MNVHLLKCLSHTAKTHIKRQLISGDKSHKFEKATTHIERQLISNIEIENSIIEYQLLTDVNLQSINSSLKQRREVCYIQRTAQNYLEQLSEQPLSLITRRSSERF